MSIKTSKDKKKIKKVENVKLEPLKMEEPEPLHIIEELDIVREFFNDGVSFGMREPNLKEIKNKINEIIREVNKMMRGGRC